MKFINSLAILSSLGAAAAAVLARAEEMDIWNKAQILINDDMYVEIPEYPPGANQITVPLPKIVTIDFAEVVDGYDNDLDLDCFFSAPYEKWPTKNFNNVFPFAANSRNPGISAQFITCFKMPITDSEPMAVWIRQRNRVKVKTPLAEGDPLLEHGYLKYEDTTVQKSDLIFVERESGGNSGKLDINPGAVIVGARIIGSAMSNNHRYCELQASPRDMTVFFTENQPWSGWLGVVRGLVCYWKEVDGKGILG